MLFDSSSKKEIDAPVAELITAGLSGVFFAHFPGYIHLSFKHNDHAHGLLYQLHRLMTHYKSSYTPSFLIF